MGKWIHQMSDRDVINRKGVCKKCGPVELVDYFGTLRCPNSVFDGQRSTQMRRMGITRSEADSLKKKAGFKCNICKRDGTTRNLHIDHDHSTGAMRGILCTRCNNILGFAELNGGVPHLNRMIAYLNKHSA